MFTYGRRVSGHIKQNAYGYGLTLLVIAVATALRAALPAVFGDTTYLAFFPAVVAAAALGGLGPAVLATVAGALIEDWVFAPPQGMLTVFYDPVQFTRSVVFVLSGLIIGAIAEKRRRGRVREQLQTEKLADLVRLTDMATIFIRDANSRIVHWTKGCESLYGFTSAEASGQISYELLSTRFPEPLDRIEEAVAEEGRWKGELAQTRKDGREISVASMWILSRESDIGPAAILEVNTDVTALKRAEQALQRINRTLEETVAERTALAEVRARQLQALAVQLSETEDRERRRLSEILHDDLQQLIVGAQMHLAVVAHQPPTDPSVALAIKRASRLLDDSLVRARDLAHRLSPPVLNQRGLVAALNWLARQMHEVYGLQVSVQAEQDAEPKSRARKSFLFKSVQEMLFNVLKHAGTRQATTTVYGRDGRIVVEVRDSGRGFDVSKFADPTRAGFGLFSIQQRAEQMAGSLVIKSAVGEGTHLILAIPDEDESEEAPVVPASNGLSRPQATAAEPRDVSVPDSCSLGRPIRLLLADDHDIFRESLATLLSQEPDLNIVGHAANGREAVDLTAQLRPDIVLMDITMPILDGIEATRQIKAAFPTTRVIGLSMHIGKDMAAEMFRAGSEQFLSKDVSPEQLLREIRRAGCPAPWTPQELDTPSGMNSGI